MSSYFFAVCSLVGIGWLALANQTALAKQLDNWHLLPRSQNVTELYFVDHQSLPSVLTPGKKHPVTFTVRNIEHQTTTYRYVLVAQASNGKKQTLYRGTLTLDHNQSRSIKKKVAVPILGGRVAIKVNLEYTSTALGDDAPSRQTQSIHYWMKPGKERHGSS